MRSDIFTGILAYLTPPDVRPPTMWAEDNIYVSHSERKPGPFERQYAPWLVEPIDCLADPNIFASSLVKPVQSGGTQALEIFAAWCLANVPGPAILTGQTDKDVEAIFQDKFLKTLKASPGTAPLLNALPVDSIKKDRLDLPSMPWDVQGPGGNKIHSKTKRYLFNDEVWKYDSGVFNMLLKRTDAVTGRKVMSVSQAGKQVGYTQGGQLVWDEWGNWWHTGTQEEFRIACPSCSGYFMPETSCIEWETNEETRDAQTKLYNFHALKKTVRMKCPLCGELHHPGNTKEERQAFVHKLAMTGKYFQTNFAPREGHRSFRYSIWVVWWKDWGDMVEEYLLAKERLRVGIVEDYMSWIQQREARFWMAKDDEVPVFSSKPMAGYRLADYVPKDGVIPRWDGEISRIMAVDVQSDCYKIGIRAFKTGGDSRLLTQKTVGRWEDVEELAEVYGLQDDGKYRKVFVDAGNWGQDVAKICNKNRWIALKGRDHESWKHQEFRLISSRPYSPAQKIRITTSRRGEFAWVHDWSNKAFKDQLSKIIAGVGIVWEYPDDVEQEYITALESEKKDEKTGRWLQIGNRPNHFWDVENMILVGATITNTLQPPPQAKAEGDKKIVRKILGKPYRLG